MLDGKSGLAENIGQSPFRKRAVLGDDRTVGLFLSFLFERYVAALLPQFDETCPFEGADKPLTRNTRQLWHLLGDFDNRPEGLLIRLGLFRAAPRFEVELNRLAKVRPRGFDVFALRSDVEFRTTGHV